MADHDLPGRPLPRLDPPAGAYEAVSARARRRRTRRAAAGASALVLVGAVVVGGAVLASPGAERDTLLPPATAAPSTTATPPETTASATSAAPVPVAPTATRAPGRRATTPPPAPLPTTTTTATPAPPPATCVFRGQVLDPGGAPVAGAWVSRLSARYSWQDVLSEPDRTTQTAADGTYEVTGQQGDALLLSTWRIGGQQPDGTRNLAATYADGTGAPCAATEPVRTTRMRVGAVLEGALEGGQSQGGGVALLSLGLDSRTFPEAGFDHTRDTYRFVGLPSGTTLLGSVLGGPDEYAELELQEGRTTTYDFAYCDGCVHGKRP